MRTTSIRHLARPFARPPAPRGTPLGGMRLLFAVCVYAAGLWALDTRAAPIVWTMAGDLNDPRFFHTATLLPNGKVMVHGGYQILPDGLNVTTLFSTELFDSVTRTWLQVGGAYYARGGHQATMLQNGRVLVTGGNTAARSEELFDPTNNNWYATMRLLTPRVNHTASRLHDGRVLVAGGWNPEKGYLTNAEIYDPLTQTWSETGGLNIARYGHVANVLPNGTVVVIGGSPVSGEGNTAELFDPASGTWSMVGGMFYDRGGFMHRSTTLQDGQAVVTGGAAPYVGNINPSLADVEVFSPATLNFYSVGKLNQPRRYHEAVLLPNGKVMVSGGFHRTREQPSLSLTSTELFDPTSMVWSEVGHMNIGRELFTLTALPDGRVLAAGGTRQKDRLPPQRTSELFISGFGARVDPGKFSSASFGMEFWQELTLVGGTSDPVEWSISSGRLPPDLQLDPVKGVLHGRLNASGTYAFTVRGTTGEMFGETTYTLEIKGPTSVAVSTSLDPIVSDRLVTLIARIASDSGGLPGGTVTFATDEALLGEAVLSDGEARLTILAPAASASRDLVIRASYAGDANCAPATGAIDVRVFDHGVMDGGTGDMLLFNADGSYVFVHGTGKTTVVFTGQGEIATDKCSMALSHLARDRQIEVTIDLCSPGRPGAARVYYQGATYTLTDSGDAGSVPRRF